MKYLLLVLVISSIQSQAQSVINQVKGAENYNFDVLPGFVNPPRGYGEVPFYWWQGDTLTRERIQWQLDQLSNKGIPSLQINYSHRDSGGLTYGLSNPSKPPLFSAAWWDLYRWFSEEAYKRDMTVSLSDYTLGVGQGFAMDEALKDNPDLNGSVLRSRDFILTGKVNKPMPENLLSLHACKIRGDNTIIPGTRTDLLTKVKDGTLIHNFGKPTWKVIAVYPEKIIPSFDPMNPESGKAYIHFFFEKFEKALHDNGRGRLDFFFSDELNFRLGGDLWDNKFAEEFKRRKGYDIVPFLDELFVESDPSFPVIRLDYNDVVVSLSEENFFEPIYRWHQDRGMTFGCDHGGRGRDVTEFGDYFRTQRWNQGPGSDQPRLSKDIIKAKVASSIAHLYQRPRVWLEGFHSSGWGTSSAEVTDAIFANFVAGYNLLSFHGLYYSTMGGWWEWAPPCNHFRMPYWKQIDPLMKCIQRLSYLLSQGYHSCDIAIIYPTEPVVAGMDGEKSVDIAFRTGEILYDRGIDFDFIDYQSIAKAETKDGTLRVSGEKYKVLVVPSMKAIHSTTLRKIEEFENTGGLVVNIGDLPEATDRTVKNDPATYALIGKIFLNGGKLIRCESPDEVPSAISGRYDAGFRIISGISERPYITHRIIGKRDVFILYNLPGGSKCCFNVQGPSQLWNPWTGEVLSLSEFAVRTGNGTEIRLPLTEKEIRIIVFDHEGKDEGKPLTAKNVIREYDLDGKWEFELKPSLDNRWGDFQLPASDELIGAEVRELYLKNYKTYPGAKNSPEESGKKITCGFGNQFLKLGPLSEMLSEKEIAEIEASPPGNEIILNGKSHKWEDYSFSWKQGVEGDYGHQGYHGLKGEMYDNFIRLGELKDVNMSLRRVPESGGDYYVLLTTVIAPDDGEYDLLTGEIKPAGLFVNGYAIKSESGSVSLKKGANPVLMIYNKACETYLLFRIPGKHLVKRAPVSMKWYKDYAVLPFGFPDDNKRGLFSFRSAPGLKALSFSAYGSLTVLSDGVKCVAEPGMAEPDGLTPYTVKVENGKKGGSDISIRIDYQPGHFGAGAIPDYLRETCGKGEITPGDWSAIDGLRSYSGGAWYRKTIEIEAEDLTNYIEIDLGDLVSSAELFVNGRSAGIKLAPPWTFDITSLASAGRNDIEVMVYNTLSNHYTSIPTRYRGNIKSGMIGPVKMRYLK